MISLPIRAFLGVVLSGSMVVVWTGCGKKAEKAPAAAAAQPEQPAAAQAAAPAPAEKPAPAYVPAPVFQTDPNAAVAEANRAIKAREYEEAAKALLAAQAQKQISDQQARAVRNQMVQFQRDLSAAVASGDPKAKAAAEMLRASSSH